MAGEAEDSGVVKQAAAALPDDVIVDIFLRMPPKSLLRCCFVCKHWRRLGSGRDFLVDHHLRQPAQPLLRIYRTAGEDLESRLLAFLHYCLEAVNLRLRRPCAEPLQTVVRFKDKEYIDLVDEGIFDALEVHGSCNGLLLLNYVGAFFVCNPATRRWAPLALPSLRPCDVVGFYAHTPSGEYRVLYRLLLRARQRHFDERRYYVLTVGSQHPRRIKLRVSSDSDSVGVAQALSKGGLVRVGAMPPVLLHGCLHWPPQPLQQGNILVFDTVAEEFRWMRPPMARNNNILFETEGMLALSYWACEQNVPTVYLWIMQDYETNDWFLKCRIQLPVIEVNDVHKGMPVNVAIVSQEEDMLVEFRDMVLHCDNEGTLLHTSSPDGPVVSFTRHMLKASLVQHPFLKNRQDGGVDEPPFFKGM